MKKVIVIGCPGSGKSTFSRALHEKTGIPLHHLDRMSWNADRTKVDRAVFQSRLNAVLRQDTWILDGNYRRTMALRMQACNTVFFLDFPFEVCLEGVRARCGTKHPDLPWTEPEDESDPEFLAFIAGFREEQRPVILTLLEQYADRQVHIFTSREQADAFLHELRND